MNRLQDIVRTLDQQFPREEGAIAVASFSDASGLKDFEQQVVNDLVNRIPLFKGEAGGTRFGSEDILNRAVVAEVLFRLAVIGKLPHYSIPDQLDDIVLADVSADAWYHRSMTVAVHNGVFHPQDQRVRPEDSVNWAELVTILRRFLDLKTTGDSTSSFFSVPAGEWFTEEFYILQQLGILPLFSQDPGSEVKKIEFAALVFSAVGKGSFFSGLETGDDRVISCDQEKGFLCYFRAALHFKNAAFCDRNAPSTNPLDCFIGVFQDSGVNAIDCEQIASTHIDSCYAAHGFVYADADICEQALDQNVRDTCLRLAAFSSKKTAHCDKIVDSQYAEICLLEAIKTDDDISACDTFVGTDSYIDCFRQVTWNAKDITTCSTHSEKLGMGLDGETPMTPDECYWSLFRGDIIQHEEWCENISSSHRYQDDPLRDVCWQVLGESTREFSWCERIEDATVQQGCYMVAAKSKSDPSYCPKIKDQERRDICYQEVAYRSDDDSLCEQIQGDKDLCYSLAEKTCTTPGCFVGQQAKEKKTPELCATIDNDFDREDCYWEFLTEAENADFCTVFGPYKQELCRSHFLQKTQDRSICERLPLDGYNTYGSLLEGLTFSVGDQAICYMELLELTADGSLCERITPNDRDACYHWMAQDQQDPQWCLKNIRQSSQQSCLTDLERTFLNKSSCSLLGDPVARNQCHIDVEFSELQFSL